MRRTCLWLAFFAFFTALIAVVGAEDKSGVTEPRYSYDREVLLADCEKRSFSESTFRNNVSVVIVQQPIAEKANTSFRIQPILRLQESTDEEYLPSSPNSVYWWTTVTLYRVSNETAEKDFLMGNTTLRFVEQYANFSDLKALNPHAGYVLEFHIMSSDNKSEYVSSKPFPVYDHSLAVHVPSVQVKPGRNGTFAVTPRLQLWNFVLDKPAEEIILKGQNITYFLALRFDDCYQGQLKGDTSGVFPDGRNQTMPYNLVITHTGYHYQLNVTVTSPRMQITITNISAPFDAVMPFSRTAVLRHTIVLFFNGSREEFEVDRDLFLATFLNSFGSRHDRVFWTNATFLGGELSIQIILIGEEYAVKDTELDLWRDSKKQYTIDVSGVSYALQQKMRVEGKDYYGNDDPPIDPILMINGLSVATIFTIVLMSFLCASFVIAVFLWRIRERKVLESYNRRVRTRRRQNGHVNNAYENTENGARNNERSEVYLIALNQRSKESACSEMDALRRCSSGGLGTSRDLRNVRRANAKHCRDHNDDDDDDDDEADVHKALNGGPSDDIMGYDDVDKQDETFQEVFFSPPTSRPATIASSTSSFHDDYLLDDLPGPSGAKIAKGGTSSANLSTPTESTASSYQTARAVSRILVSPASETCSFPCSSGSSYAICDKFRGAL